MRENIIRTNSKCSKCEGFLVFEVQDLEEDSRGTKIMYGVWTCAVCGGGEPVIWASYRKRKQLGDKKSLGLITIKVGESSDMSG